MRSVRAVTLEVKTGNGGHFNVLFVIEVNGFIIVFKRYFKRLFVDGIAVKCKMNCGTKCIQKFIVCYVKYIIVYKLRNIV